MTNVLTYLTVPSTTDPRKKYTIPTWNDLPISCTCPSWRYGIQKEQPFLCKHMMTLVKED